MIVTTAIMTLRDPYGQNYSEGVFWFTSEPHREAWQQELSDLMDEFAWEVWSPYLSMERLLVSYEDDVVDDLNLVGALPAPPPAELASRIKRLYYTGELDLRVRLAVAA